MLRSFIFWKILFYISFIPLSHSQSKTIDSLQLTTNKKLKSLLKESSDNDSLMKLYAKSYLTNAKLKNNTLQTAVGYYYLAKYEKNNPSKLLYLDSLIYLTAKTKDSIYPEFAFLYRGSIYHKNKEFKKALDDYIAANTYAKEKGNDEIIEGILLNIGILKSAMGDYGEALPNFKKYYHNLIDKNTASTFKNLSAMFHLASTYKHLGILDSASFYHKKGFEYARKEKDSFWYYQFVYNEGITKYYQKEYQEAIDSIKKAIPYFKKEESDLDIMALYAYRGKSLFQLKKTAAAINYLKKSALLFEKNNYVVPELRDSHEILINYYKNKNDIENHLKHVILLMKFDSILQNDYKYLTKKILTEYEPVQLIEEKEKIIEILEQQKKSAKLRNNLLLTSLGLAIIFIFYFFNKHRIYKKRFDRFITDQKNTKAPTTNKVSKKAINVPKEIIENIVKGLGAFEKKQEYIYQHITLGSLAKKLNTNSKYLSMVINFNQNKSFRTYLNDLRVQYAIDRLQNEHLFRKYAVKSIAYEVGFSHPETFAKAFYRYTGVYPSFFIKQLEKS